MVPSCVKIPIPCICQSDSDSSAENYAQKKKQETYYVTVRKLRIPLDQSTVPVLCVLLLIASGDSSFSASNAWIAMKGKDIKPWAVLGLLFGLCYLCITLDLTGILQGLAKKSAKAAEPFATKLFLYIFLFAAILTVITNNDISIICLTPLVISTANSGDLDATPFIFMVLFVSNTFSMLLVTGNPANLIVSESADIPYVDYLKYMALPTIITGAVLYGEIYAMFRKGLKQQFKTEDTGENWRDAIKLPRYAIFCAIRLFAACIGIPIVGFIQEAHANLKDYPLDMFVVAGVALISMIIDLMAFDIRRLAQFSSSEMDLQISLLDENKKDATQNTAKNGGFNLQPIDETHDDPYTVELSGPYQPPMQSTNDSTEMVELKENENETETEKEKGGGGMTDTIGTRVTHNTFQTYDDNHLLYDKLNLKIITFAFDALWELPWKLIPFVFSLFIIVGFMDAIGLVDAISDTLISISGTSEWIAMFVVGFVATFLCQCVNNQPMTVLLSTVLSRAHCAADSDTDTDSDTGHCFNDDITRGAYFALAIGANLGGNGTPVASLAVLMWRGILEKWGLYVDYFGFSKRGLAVTPLLVGICVFIVAIEDMYVFA